MFELHDEHGLHVHWLVDRFVPVQIVRRIAECHGFGRAHVKRRGKWVGDYLAKHLGKEIRAACLKGKWEARAGSVLIRRTNARGEAEGIEG